jgi:hypothetical protein
MSNGFATLENFDDGNGGSQRDWERTNISENINALATESLGYYELKEHKNDLVTSAQNY